AQNVADKVANIEVIVSSWVGKISFVVIPLDDFDIIFGNDFLFTAKVFVCPHLGRLMIMDEQHPCFVAACKSPKKEKGKGMLSAIQLKKSLKKGEETYLVTLIEINPDQLMDVSDEVAYILEEFADVMPPEFP